MIVAIDVHYKEECAKSVMLLFEHWESETPFDIIETRTKNVADYVPGKFYERELPCILDALKEIDATTIQFIVIDGYVYINNDLEIGLGGHLYDALEKQIPVIGVAKTPFMDNKDTVVEVFRGSSQKPLYVSAIGLSKEDAARYITNMYGDFRLPFLLKLMDQKTKEA